MLAVQNSHIFNTNFDECQENNLVTFICSFIYIYYFKTFDLFQNILDY